MAKALRASCPKITGDVTFTAQNSNAYDWSTGAISGVTIDTAPRQGAPCRSRRTTRRVTLPPAMISA